MRVSNMPTNTIFQKLLVLFFFVFGTQFFAQDSIATPSTFQVEMVRQLFYLPQRRIQNLSKSTKKLILGFHTLAINPKK